MSDHEVSVSATVFEPGSVPLPVPDDQLLTESCQVLAPFGLGSSCGLRHEDGQLQQFFSSTSCFRGSVTAVFLRYSPPDGIGNVKGNHLLLTVANFV